MKIYKMGNDTVGAKIRVAWEEDLAAEGASDTHTYVFLLPAWRLTRKSHIEPSSCAPREDACTSHVDGA
jgi:hypothetical protein